MKLKSILILLVIVCINGESNPISVVKSLLKGIAVTLEFFKPTHVIKVISHNKYVSEILLDGVNYKIITNEEGSKVLKKIKEIGKWVIVEEIVANNVLNAASALSPCILSAEENKRHYKKVGLNATDLNTSVCDSTEDVINLKALADTHGSTVDKLKDLGWTSLK